MPKEKKRANWKKRFYILLTVNSSIVVLLTTLILWPVEEVTIPQDIDENKQPNSEFFIRTTKENLNELVNAYLDELLQGTKHRYRITLEDDVHLQGELPVFSSTVPLSVHLEPFVQKNGDVILKQRSISIGLLQLPNKKIMEYMKKYLPMPEWVTVNPKKEEIYVAVTKMDIKSNFHVSVEHIDLEANNLALKIKVPYQTLGIDSPTLEE
ncbi:MULTISPECIES: YpmS family protein [unclassified Virgibacillus]|uniref:YpmS family protein n=1 Tax=unclassified Virgibacillus TaxID=2620237 RepID=UPI0024DE4E6F|nr:YpmS family protein [Virgibacillus sp. LDC-1]